MFAQTSMSIQKTTIEEFLKLAKQHPIIDVRSPGEYTQAHIPSAYSLPLFSDEERKQVGTAYKQQSRESAIKIGLDYFGVNMRKMVEETESIVTRFESAHRTHQKRSHDASLESKNILVHCWRGGMRSGALAWLLGMYGFNVYVLAGGYKAYRRWVLAQFEEKYKFNIIGGYTGSGKTLILHQLKKFNKTVIDLEALANHKGSAFGSMEDRPQPKQEMFENMLAEALVLAYSTLSGNNNGQPTDAKVTMNSKHCVDAIYLEDESQRIGNLQIPMPLWDTMRRSPVYFIDIPFEKRLEYITEDYGKQEKDKLIEAILRIQKRLGGLETKNAIRFLEEGNQKDCFRILLSYYDKWYYKGLLKRENLSTVLNKIPCTGVDTITNTKKILSCDTVSA